MTVIILAEAEQEFAKDAAFYEDKQPGLGNRFRNEVAQIVDAIWQNPELPRLREKGYRRVNLKVFPHYVAYVIHNEIIWVMAISHASKKPEYWLTRF
jgi:hypothetical protein